MSVRGLENNSRCKYKTDSVIAANNRSVLKNHSVAVKLRLVQLLTIVQRDGLMVVIAVIIVAVSMRVSMAGAPTV